MPTWIRSPRGDHRPGASSHDRQGAFQETDIFGLTLPIVKHSYLITDVNDIPRIIKEAFHVAQTGRPGPVLVDIPKNVQQQRTRPVFPAEVNLRGYNPDKRADDLPLNEIIGLIEKAERPVLYVGGGIISANATNELLEFAEATGIPVTTTIMGCGAFPSEHPLSLAWLGMHGAAYANWAVSGEFRKETRPDGTERTIPVAPGADLLLAFGVRFDDRVTGKVDKFCEHGTIVHIDIDASELNKNRKAHLPVVSDIRYALNRLNELVRKRPFKISSKPGKRRSPRGKPRRPFAIA
jgi:acetolactate synthase I/II/III large subunit